MKIEACVSSIESIEEAIKGGAFRVELCDNLMEGGTTPSYGMIKQILLYKSVKVFVIIRPRGGNFVYHRAEVEVMKQDIQLCGELGCNGVVFGVLTADNKVDVSVNKELIDIAKQYDMDVTFHRAFDRLTDLEQGLEEIITLGFDRILTSGGYPDVMQGKHSIMSLIKQAKGRIRILPGGGITKDNVASFVQDLDIEEIHGTFKEDVSCNLRYENDYFENDYVTSQTSASNIKEAKESLNKIVGH